MALVAIVTVLLLMQLFAFAILVGKARGVSGISAPTTSGNELFERHNRVHLNTIEQLIIVIPAMWIFASFLNSDIAAGLGLVFFISRLMYQRAYVKDPSKRAIAFTIGALATVSLLLGAMAGAVISLL